MACPFEWLYDGLPEDGIQEHASLRGDLASNGAEAAARMLALYERDVGPLSAYGAGVHFAVGYLRPLRANITIYNDDGDDLEVLYGSLAEEHANKQNCLDELFHASCEPDDEGAADWWHLDLVFPVAHSEEPV